MINRLMESAKPETPEVGMGATELSHSDRTPYTVIEVSESGKTCKVQEDTAIRTDKNGMTDSGQTYLFTPNPEGNIVTLRQNRKGQWVHKGTVFRMGARDKYHDFSF